MADATTMKDLIVDRIFVKHQAELPPNSIGDRETKPTAGIAASKTNHQQRPRHAESLATTAHTLRVELFSVLGTAGTLLQFYAGLLDPCVGDSTITIDLYKNGVSVLSAPIVLTSANTARQVVAAVLSIPVAALVAGDVFEGVVAVSAGSGTLGKGVFFGLVADETYVAA
ncbi:MAG: hypothetical protein QM775_16660 [Pirellulales bacterium]